MLSASASRAAARSCPGCRIHLLSLFENGFVGPAHRRDASSLLRRLRRPSPTTNRPFANTHRLLTTSAPRWQHASTELDQMEQVARQARHAFGRTLPKDYLTPAEYEVYERLYGPPIRETEPADVALDTRGFEDGPLQRQNKPALFRADESGDFEQVPYWEGTEESLPPPSELDPAAQADAATGTDVISEPDPSPPGLEYIQAVAKNDREYAALLKLQRDFELAAKADTLEDYEKQVAAEELRRESHEEAPSEEAVDEVAQEHDDDHGLVVQQDEAHSPRSHRYQSMATWGEVSDKTRNLPESEFIGSIKQLLQRTDMRHVREAAERVYGGKGLPDSVGTPHGLNKGQRPVAQTPNQSKMTEIEADAYMASNLPGVYTTAESILVEVRKRLGGQWLTKLIERQGGEGPRVLDVGAGGAGLVAWQNILQAHWETMTAGARSSPPYPPGKKTVVVGSEPLRHRISRFLDNTQFLPRLPDYIHSASANDLDAGESRQGRKQFDVIIATHNLMPQSPHQRRNFIDNLWQMLSPEGGVLVVAEKAHPRGFEAVADVRSRLIKEFIHPSKEEATPEGEAAAKGEQDAVEGEPATVPRIEKPKRPAEPGAIIAPCTSHDVCPMYTVPGEIPGRKDFCSFEKRFHRPKFVQQLHGKTDGDNHEDIGFSFIAVQRGLPAEMREAGELANGVPESPTWHQKPAGDGTGLTQLARSGYEHAGQAPNPHGLPRMIRAPLKRRGHVVLDVCTPEAKLERWTVPKSFSSQAYRDARKAKWGDLWALGAKTSVPITVRYGRGGPVPDDGGVRAQRAKAGAGKVVNVEAGRKGIVSATTSGSGRGHVNERRTKGGRKPKVQNELMDELKD